jgi:hypothetical protein
MIFGGLLIPVTPSMALVVKFEDPSLEDAQLSFSHSKIMDTCCLLNFSIECKI